MSTSRRRAALATVAACLLVLPPLQTAVAAPERDSSTQTTTETATPKRAVYTVHNTDSSTRTEINRIGAQVLSVQGATATVEATQAQAEQLRGEGFTLSGRTEVADTLGKLNSQRGRPFDFPPDDQGYHNYQEMVGELETATADHPNITSMSSAGKSFEGRDIPVLKISDNAGQDEDEPEVLFTCNQHAREHLTTEMCLRIVNRFTDEYAGNDGIKNTVDNREIWVIPTVNPDGSIFDVASGQYEGWRKNRQDAGTDLNRNWGYKWGCCGGSSGDPNSETFRGNEAFSAPETKAIRDFTNSRVINGTQQIKASLDFHTYSELVMWPFGHTSDQVTEGMTQQEYDRFEQVGTQMAETNGYTPQQSSALYVTDGDITDWMWGQHKIFSFVFEMYPSEGGIDGFYPPDEVIERETTRNDQAVDILLKEAGA